MEADLDATSCRHRQERLLQVMHRRNLDWVIVQLNEHIQWLSGVRLPWTFAGFAALHTDGQLSLVVPQKHDGENQAVDRFATYDAKWHSTMRNDQRQAASESLLKLLGREFLTQRVGVEFSCASRHLEWDQQLIVDVEPDMYSLRRRKEADELRLLQKAIDATGDMYRAAREMIAPGVSEIEVFNQLQSVAVAACGEMLTGTGNDYQCASRGGPPRDGRCCQAGELYILDLGPAYRGYFADNCRTIAVTEADDVQMEAWSRVIRVFDLIESSVRPGVSCRELFQQVQLMLDDAPNGIFNHHLGHGIGLFPHEGPHLNPHWDDIFELGDVFTVEPGLYDERLNFGMRLENDYVVTKNGVQLLSDFPLELSLS